jgi:hypothetical protein
LLFNHAKKSGIFLHLSLFLGLVFCEVWNCISLWKVFWGDGTWFERLLFHGFAVCLLQVLVLCDWHPALVDGWWQDSVCSAMPSCCIGSWTIENTLWIACKCFTLAVLMLLFPTTHDA